MDKEKMKWFDGILKRKPIKFWKVQKQKVKIIKPCHSCGFCPYGQLVEAFPLREKRNGFSCKVFGHDCPAFYGAELMAEGD